MCKSKKGMHGVGNAIAMPSFHEPDWGQLAAVVLGAAASNVIVNPIVDKIFSKKTPKEKEALASYVKLGVGSLGLFFSPNEYIADAALGVLVDGGMELLRDKVPQLQQTFKGTGGGGVGQVIDLSNVNWRQLNGIETDYSVGNLEGNLQGSSVSGGVN